MTLKPDELVVTSFETSGDVLNPVTDPNDPTPATHCFVCPEETQVPCD